MVNPIGLAIAIAGGVLSTILAGTGSVIGIGYTGQAAAGVLSEDPDKFGPLLPLVALPGTQGFYGFIGTFVLIMKIGLLGGNIPAISLWQGVQLFVACMPVAVAGFLSAIWQGRVCTAGIEMVAKKSSETAKALIYGILVEIYAVLGLIITILVLTGMKF